MSSLNFKILAASALTGAASVGVAVGYLVANHLWEQKFQEELAKEIEDAKSLYQNMYSTPVFVAEEPADDEAALLEMVREADEKHDPAPVDLVGRALQARAIYEGVEEQKEDQDATDERKAPVNVTNVFVSNTPPSDEVLEALMAERDPSVPYIITKGEFFDNEGEFEQVQFTYWAGDGILTDDREEMNPIQDTDMVAGDENLYRFGYGSGDENVLYVRNPTLDPPMDLHITKADAKYSVDVQGLDDDEPYLKHSQPRKFRIRDE